MKKIILVKKYVEYFLYFNYILFITLIFKLLTTSKYCQLYFAIKIVDDFCNN